MKTFYFGTSIVLFIFWMARLSSSVGQSYDGGVYSFGLVVSGGLLALGFWLYGFWCGNSED